MPTLSGSPVCGVWVILKQFQGVRTVLFGGNASWERLIQKSLILESNFLASMQVGISTRLAEVQEENYFPVRKFSIEKETFLSHTCSNPCNLVIKKLVQVGKPVE